MSVNFELWQNPGVPDLTILENLIEVTTKNFKKARELNIRLDIGDDYINEQSKLYNNIISRRAILSLDMKSYAGEVGSYMDSLSSGKFDISTITQTLELLLNDAERNAEKAFRLKEEFNVFKEEFNRLHSNSQMIMDTGNDPGFPTKEIAKHLFKILFYGLAVWYLPSWASIPIFHSTLNEHVDATNEDFSRRIVPAKFSEQHVGEESPFENAEREYVPVQTNLDNTSGPKLESKSSETIDATNSQRTSISSDFAPINSFKNFGYVSLIKEKLLPITVVVAFYLLYNKDQITSVIKSVKDKLFGNKHESIPEKSEFYRCTESIKYKLPAIDHNLTILNDFWKSEIKIINGNLNELKPLNEDMEVQLPSQLGKKIKHVWREIEEQCSMNHRKLNYIITNNSMLGT
ncbi:7465_t:CDS:1 [Acaulospora morrowiae]|uniref:7465_t:CDS:1 n=1 Tax=Acaulospora morrowiae TaxID=94023 RepID=A0A9N8VPY9_9GLOM|nr:7465_t:CDS:1 [Acaulospora morrowiae]